ncbi:hypothetical protein GCM10027168_12740 [Streptomyces capparidis]
MVGHLLVEGGEQVPLAGEVPVEQRAGDSGAFGDVLHQHLVVRVRGEEPCGDGEELGAAFCGAESLTGRHGTPFYLTHVYYPTVVWCTRVYQW